jgi:signal peptidase I
LNKVFSKFFWVLGAALLMRACVLEPVRSADDSMSPQVLSGDTILVSKLRYGLRVPGAGAMLLEWQAPQKGDLVVAVSVSEPPVNLLRRIAGIPGETVKLPDGKDLVLGESQYFLAAEQKENTMDSRQFGPVSRRAIIGKATHIWFPGNQNPSAGESSKVESKKSRILQTIL